MRRLRFSALLALLALLLLLGAHSSAQAPPAPTEPAAAEPAGTASAPEPLTTFEPSEDVPADVAVAFPVDI